MLFPGLRCRNSNAQLVQQLPLWLQQLFLFRKVIFFFFSFHFNSSSLTNATFSNHLRLGTFYLCCEMTPTQSCVETFPKNAVVREVRDLLFVLSKQGDVASAIPPFSIPLLLPLLRKCAASAFRVSVLIISQE